MVVSSSHQMGLRGRFSARTLRARCSGSSSDRAAGGNPSERQRLACQLLTRGRADLMKRRWTRMFVFMLQASRAVLRPHLFAMLPGERVHAGADAMLTLLQLPVEQA
jgi:hypothetical protein